MDQTKVTTSEAKSKSRDKALEIIRTELNLEQWSVWQPANSRSAPKARVLTRELTLSDGSKAVAQVKVGFTDNGVLTTEDQKTLYALVKQWEERGKGDMITPFSLKRLAKLLRKRWGTQTVKGLISSLSRLRATPFTWTNSYFDSSTGETVEVLDMFSILSDLRIARRGKGSVITKEAGYFKFHDLVLVNLQNNHTKPVLYEVAISFQSEIAQLIYSRIDRLLVDKSQYERRTKELFDDLGIEGKAYQNLSDRKRALGRALKELVDKPLTTGRIAAATLEPTADGKDYKVVFRKAARATAAPPPIVLVGGEAVVDKDKGDPELHNQAVELVKYFFKLFQGVEKAHIGSKAVDQAISIIAHHGFAQAKHLIEFAHRVAPETGYKPQTFGGIVQYESRAIADYEEYQRRQQQRDQRELEEFELRRLEEEHAAYCTRAIDAYLESHADDLPARLAAKRKALMAERPALYSQWPEDTFASFALRAVRTDIFSELGLSTFEDYSAEHRRKESLGPSDPQ